MKKREPVKKNPIAKAVRHIRPQVVPDRRRKGERERVKKEMKEE